MPSAFEGGLQLPFQRPTSTSALAMPPPPPVPRHTSGSVQHFMPLVDPPNLKRRSTWQQARPKDLVQSAQAPSSLRRIDAGACASASSGAGTSAGVAAGLAGPSADAGTCLSCKDSERGQHGESSEGGERCKDNECGQDDKRGEDGGDGEDGEPASTRSGSHIVEQEAWESFASMLNSFEMDAETFQAEEQELYYNNAWYSGTGERLGE